MTPLQMNFVHHTSGPSTSRYAINLSMHEIKLANSSNLVTSPFKILIINTSGKRRLTVCEINFYFFPVFALNAFSILNFATVFFKFGHFPLAHFIYGVHKSGAVVFLIFTSIGFISHVGSRQVS